MVVTLWMTSFLQTIAPTLQKSRCWVQTCWQESLESVSKQLTSETNNNLKDVVQMVVFSSMLKHIKTTFIKGQNLSYQTCLDLKCNKSYWGMICLRQMKWIMCEMMIFITLSKSLWHNCCWQWTTPPTFTCGFIISGSQQQLKSSFYKSSKEEAGN